MIHQIRAIHWNSKLLASIRRVQLFENRNALTLRLDYIAALSERRIKRKVIPVQACSRPHPHLFQCGGSASALPIALRRRIDWNNRMRDRFRSNYRVTSTKVWRTEGPYSPVGGCHRAPHYRYRLNRGSFPLVTNAMTFADRRCLRRWDLRPRQGSWSLLPIRCAIRRRIALQPLLIQASTSEQEQVDRPVRSKSASKRNFPSSQHVRFLLGFGYPTSPGVRIRTLRSIT